MKNLHTAAIKLPNENIIFVYLSPNFCIVKILKKDVEIHPTKKIVIDNIIISNLISNTSLICVPIAEIPAIDNPAMKCYKKKIAKFINLQ